MPTFDEDVTIASHDLVLTDGADHEIARLTSAGDLLVRQGNGQVDQVLAFASAAASITIGDEREPGSLQIRNGDGEAIALRGRNATVDVGTRFTAGDVIVRNWVGQEAIHLIGAESGLRVLNDLSAGRAIELRDVLDRLVLRVDGATATLSLGIGEDQEGGREGDVVIRGADGRDAVHLAGGNATVTVGVPGNEGDVVVIDGDGREAVRLDGEHAIVTVGALDNEGDLILRDSFARDAITLSAGEAMVVVGTEGQEGDIVVRDEGGRDVFAMNGEHALLTLGAVGKDGDLVIRDETGTDRIQLDGSTGDIKLLGADLAEDFDAEETLVPGSVVVAVGADEVAESRHAGDRRVVGVVSGAGDLQPALRLATRPGPARSPVALVGRVNCRVDAGPGPIDIGDLLTTSATAGHAMRVDAPEAPAGTVFAKALAPLDHGTGLIPVLLMLR